MDDVKEPKFYSKKVKALVENGPKTLGTQLMSWAIYRGFSIYQVAACTGATRQTCYNWARGAKVSAPYKDRVAQLIRILHDCATADEAWLVATRKFKLLEEEQDGT